MYIAAIATLLYMKLGHVIIQGHKVGFSTGRSGIDPYRPMVVLVHGSGGSSLTWFTQLESPLLNLNLIAVDLPGHGQTACLPMERVEDYAEWLKEFIKTAYDTPCYLLGHSLGGAIAQQLALDHPEVLKGLILVGTGAKLRVSPKILEGITRDFDAAVSFIVRSCYTKDAPEDLIRDAIRLARQAGPQQLLADFTSCNQFDVTEQVEQIHLPTLIMVGREDVMTPVKYSEFLNRKIAGSRLVVMDNTGHALMHQDPETFNLALKEFISSI
jgi:pimeloyl-ACP methyl ester carboxylesterase